jgi:hypothetical protein
MIFTPTWLVNGLDAITPQCAEAIQAQVVEGGFEWVIGRDNPYNVPDHRNVLYQYRRAREIFMAGNFEAFLAVEHDMVLPDAGAAQRMMNTPGADVVYGVYVLRHGMNVLSAWQYVNDRNLGMSLSIYPAELREAVAAKAWRVSGAGFGCTLIRRHVLERLPFRDGGENDTMQICPDLPFAEDAIRAGFISMARFDVLVTHLHNGRAIHPLEEIVAMQYVARETVNAIAAGRWIHLEAGQKITLSSAEAADLARCGYIQDEEDDLTQVERAVIGPEETAVAPAQKKTRRKRA